MSGRAVFFRLLGVDDNGEALKTAVADVNAGFSNELTYLVDASSFRLIPGSPFAYWVSESMRRNFRELPPFESGRCRRKLVVNSIYN